MFEPLQNYVNLVSGATKASRERATAAARGLLAQAGLQDAATDAQERISKLADDILNASRANRELLENLIGAEVEKAATRLGFARVDQVEDLQAQIAELRRRVDELDVEPVPAAPFRAAPVPPAKKAAAKVPETGTPLAATKAQAARAPATRAPATRAPATKAPAKTTPASNAPPAGDASAARKQTTKKSPAAKAAARQSPAQKAAARQSPATTAAQRISPAERAAKRAVAPPSPLDSSGDASS